MAQILHIARMREGQEGALRAVIARCWSEVDFGAAGFTGVNIFIGSGYCATLYQFENDFKPAFSELTSSAAAQHFFGGLSEHLEDFPLPLPDDTAQIPLAGDAFRWPDRPQTAEYRGVPGQTTTLDRQHGNAG